MNGTRAPVSRVQIESIFFHQNLVEGNIKSLQGADVYSLHGQ